MKKPNANLKQVVFAVTITIITATIVGSILMASNLQTVIADQKGTGSKPPPQPDCSIYTLDGRQVFIPCYPPKPPAVDTTKTKSLLSNDDEIAKGPIQTSPSSSITTNSIPSTTEGNTMTEKSADIDSMNTPSSVEQNDANNEVSQSGNSDSTGEMQDEDSSDDSESSDSNASE